MPSAVARFVFVGLLLARCWETQRQRAGDPFALDRARERDVTKVMLGANWEGP